MVIESFVSKKGTGQSVNAPLPLPRENIVPADQFTCDDGRVYLASLSSIVLGFFFKFLSLKDPFSFTGITYHEHKS